MPNRHPSYAFTRRSYRDHPAPNPMPTLCVLWQGAVDGDGYGCLTGNHYSKRAHRWVWEAVHGKIPKNMVVRHKCDNRVCIRLSHLELGTVADNNADISKRGMPGPVPKLGPSEVAVIVDRHLAGESYAKIYPDYSMRCSFAAMKNAAKRELDRRAAAAMAVDDAHIHADKLNWDDIRTIRASKRTREELAQHYGISLLDVWRIKTNQTWKVTADD